MNFIRDAAAVLALLWNELRFEHFLSLILISYATRTSLPMV